MVAFPAFPNLRRYLPTFPTGGGIAAAIGAAVVVGMMSQDMLEGVAWTSGIATLIPAAQPPLGTTARTAIALGAALAAGAVAWASLFLLWGPGGFLARDRRHPETPTIRRADAHPDAPPRRPMTAVDLGTPFMEVPPPPPTVRPLPADLDQPLAAFDAAAIPATPCDPVPLVEALVPRERLETFALTPPPPPSVPPTRREPGTAPSIESLLRRLEEGAARRPRSANAA